LFFAADPQQTHTDRLLKTEYGIYAESAPYSVFSAAPSLCSELRLTMAFTFQNPVQTFSICIILHFVKNTDTDTFPISGKSLLFQEIFKTYHVIIAIINLQFFWHVLCFLF
jgi:hypothetical protein